MLESIQGAYGAIKGGLDIAQGFQALKTEAAVNQAIIDIQRSLLDAQRALNEAETRHAADLRSMAELEQEVVRLTDWSREADHYHLVQVDPGAFAYMPYPGMERGEPAHWLCANCFNHGRKSFVQSRGQDTLATGHLGYQRTYGCDVCGGSFKVHTATVPTYPEGEG